MRNLSSMLGLWTSVPVHSELNRTHVSTVYGTILGAWTLIAFFMEITLLKHVILTQMPPRALGNHTISVVILQNPLLLCSLLFILQKLHCSKESLAGLLLSILYVAPGLHHEC